MAFSVFDPRHELLIKGEESAIPIRRHRRIAAAALTALLSKGTFLIVTALLVPVMVRYLGPEGYGLWATISSAVMLFVVLDIGIANTLTNLISEAFAEDDQEKAAEYFATAFWLVLGIASTLGTAAFVNWPHIPWVGLFGVRSPALARQTSPAMAAAFIALLLALPTGLATRILAGYQEMHVANVFAAGGSVVSLIAVLVGVHTHQSLPILVIGYSGATVAANGVCLFWICFFHKPWMKPWPSRIQKSMIGTIFHSGGLFFVIQITSLVVFNSDNFVISHYLSPAQVTPYNVTWRLTYYITAVQALFFSSLWPAYSEAYARGDLEWIRKTYKRNRWMTSVVLAVGCAILLPGGRLIIRLWAGPAAVPSPLLLSLMCLWMIIFAFATNQACLMGATSRISKQTVAAILAAAVNLALSLLWVRQMGSVGVLLGTIVSYLVFIVWVQAREVSSILRGNSQAASALRG